MEELRRQIRNDPDSRAYSMICHIPPDQRHPSMRELPYVPAS
jgi:hypothetical protein